MIDITRQYKEKIPESVEVGQHIPRKILAGEFKCSNPALRPAADCPREMSQGGGPTPTGHDERPEFLKFLVHVVDPRLQIDGIDRKAGLDLGVSRIRDCPTHREQSTLDRHYPVQTALGEWFTHQESQDRIEFVESPVCLQPRVVLLHPATGKQRGRSIIASLRIDLHPSILTRRKS